MAASGSLWVLKELYEGAGSWTAAGASAGGSAAGSSAAGSSMAARASAGGWTAAGAGSWTAAGASACSWTAHGPSLFQNLKLRPTVMRFQYWEENSTCPFWSERY